MRINTNDDHFQNIHDLHKYHALLIKSEIHMQHSSHMSCPVCMDDDTAPTVALHPCSHRLCVICANLCLRAQGSCPLCRAPIVRYNTVSSEESSAPRCDRIWLYGSGKRSGGWWMFDSQRQRVLNEMCALGETDRKIVIGPLTFDIDLKNMRQKCVQTNRIRAIRSADHEQMETLQIHGVAGCRASPS